jgi:hypothetical protein
MYKETIFKTLNSGPEAKFTIRDRIIDGMKYCFENVLRIIQQLTDIKENK